LIRLGKFALCAQHGVIFTTEADSRRTPARRGNHRPADRRRSLSRPRAVYGAYPEAGKRGPEPVEDERERERERRKNLVHCHRDYVFSTVRTKKLQTDFPYFAVAKRHNVSYYVILWLSDALDTSWPTRSPMPYHVSRAFPSQSLEWDQEPWAAETITAWRMERSRRDRTRPRQPEP
jgi:hypothetical protein